MVQIKKPAVREAILTSAFRSFARLGYVNTTLAMIARDANVSQSNLYSYFRSKMEILAAIYDPWMRARITRMEKRIDAERDPRKRLAILIDTLWRHLPAASQGFSVNWMQAISIEGRGSGYDPTLLAWVESRIAAILDDTLPPARAKRLRTKELAHTLMMAVDGYTINYRLNPRRRCSEALVEVFAGLLLPEAKQH